MKDTIQVRDGGLYLGEWFNDKTDGRGFRLYPNKILYEGYFKNDMKHGRGRLVYDNGEVYEGEF